MMDETIKYLLEDYQPAHSEFQIKNFIIRGEVDDWARYKQALREIDAGDKNLVAKRDDLELFDLKKRRFRFGRKARIERGVRTRAKEALLTGIRETERELRVFVDVAVGLKKKFGELDPLKRAKLEAESWKQKAIKMAGIDLLVNGRVGSTTLNFILSLPKEDQALVIEHFKPGAKVDPFKMIGL